MINSIQSYQNNNGKPQFKAISPQLINIMKTHINAKNLLPIERGAELHVLGNLADKAASNKLFNVGITKDCSNLTITDHNWSVIEEYPLSSNESLMNPVTNLVNNANTWKENAINTARQKLKSALDNYNNLMKIEQSPGAKIEGLPVEFEIIKKG